jgi:membrane fusion protein, multidrug efflux system
MALNREGTLLSRARGAFTPRMWKMLFIVVGLLVFVVAYAKLAPIVKYLMMNQGDCPMCQTVSTVQAKKTVWQAQIRSVGTLHAIQGADLSSELAGIVAKVAFEPGRDVEKGALLVQLRDDSDRAQLEALRASAELATQTYARNAALLKTSAISRQAYDTAVSTMRNARAQAEAQAATVAKKAVRAPFSGRVGIRLADVGQYVNAGQPLVTLQQLDPIYVDFSVPQQQLALLKTGSKVTLTSDAIAGKHFVGEIQSFDPKVDPETRNVRVRAMVHNPGKVLIPGMFATVDVDVGGSRPLITLPQTTITYNPYGDTVFVVTKGKDAKGKPQLAVEQRFVTLGETRGDQVSVLSGLTPKDTVVSSGQIKLKNGTPVLINNAVRLPNDPAPTPVQE